MQITSFFKYIMKKTKSYFTLLFVLITDQLTKHIAVQSMNWKANTGISFGIFPEFPLWAFFVLVSLVFLVMIIYKIKLNFAWSLFIAGMSGNLIDRIRFGYVVDWIPFPFPFIDRLYMNIADMALILGFLCLILYSLKKTSHE